MNKDYIVGFTLFNPKYNGFKTMYRHFGSLEHAKTFASNINIKNNCIIYESLDINENENLKKDIEELKKYDYRKIKIDEENKIISPSFTKEQLDLMNLGIALYVGIPKLLEDEEGEIEV